MGREVEKPPYQEFNIGGALLGTLRQDILENLALRIRQSGVSHLSMLPVRGIPDQEAVEKFGEFLGKNEMGVAHLEEAWNPTNHRKLGVAMLSSLLVGPVKRFLGNKSAPVFWDGLFPNREICQDVFGQMRRFFPGVKVISHSIEDALVKDKLVETSRPMLSKGREAFLDLVQEKGIALVFDPAHLEYLGPGKTISYPSQPTVNDQRGWENHWLAFSATGLVRVVDFRPPVNLKKILLGRDDYGGLTVGKGKLMELAAAAKKTVSVEFFRVEAILPPGELLFGDQTGKIEVLSVIAEQLKKA